MEISDVQLNCLSFNASAIDFPRSFRYLFACRVSTAVMVRAYCVKISRVHFRPCVYFAQAVTCLIGRDDKNQSARLRGLRNRSEFVEIRIIKKSGQRYMWEKDISIQELRVSHGLLPV